MGERELGREGARALEWLGGMAEGRWSARTGGREDVGVLGQEGVRTLE